MIRPLTIATFLLACGSGLFLYQSKHEVQVVDRTIEKTVHDTNALREQSRLLAAEWTMLNDPDRLRQFADQYLALKSINPTQFTSLAELTNRLPAVEAAPPPPPEDVPVAAATPAQPDAEPAPTLADATPSTTSRTPPVVIAARPADTKNPDSKLADGKVTDSRLADSKTADARPADARPADSKLADTRAADAKTGDYRPTSRSAVADARQPVQRPLQETRVAAAPAPRPIILGSPRPQPVSQPVSAPVYAQYARPAPIQQPYAQPRYAQPAYGQPRYAPTAYAQSPAPTPYTGSLLGMAHTTLPPAPRPTPVNATYNNN